MPDRIDNPKDQPTYRHLDLPGIDILIHDSGEITLTQYPDGCLIKEQQIISLTADAANQLKEAMEQPPHQGRPVNPGQIIHNLNSMVEADSEAIRKLIEYRVPCNESLAIHPTCQVGPLPALPGDFVGMLGVINGMLGEVPAIASMFDERGALIKFVRASDNSCKVDSCGRPRAGDSPYCEGHTSFMGLGEGH